MFPREQRLHSSKDILSVFRRGERRTFGLVSCNFLAKPGTVGTVAVIVDTKVSKKAVVRNLYKRRIRAYLQERGLPEGQLIVRLLKGADQVSFTQLTEQLSQCLRRLSR